MFRYGARTFVTSARRLAEPSAHTIRVSKAQGIARGLTEGMIFHRPYPILPLFAQAGKQHELTPRSISDW